MNTTRVIEAYLDGSLGKEETEEIKTRAEHDLEFANLIRLHKEVNESIRDSELNNLRQILRKISAEKNPSIVGKIFLLRRIMQISAALLFILIIGTTVGKLFFPEHTGSSIFEKFYLKYEPDVITRSGESFKNSLENAIYLYQAGDYSESTRMLADIVNNDKLNYQAMFYLGLTNIELQQPKESINDFLKIPSDWNSPYLIHRNWYLALCLNKTGHEKQALPLLNAMTGGEEFYAERARKIISRIRI
jgi:hypothetical protein